MPRTPDPKTLPILTRLLACATIIAGTVMGLAGIDLVLPSVPEMPGIFSTDIATSQLVLALFVAGTMVGLISFGSLAEHFGRRRLFIGSLLAYALVSLGAAYSNTIETLILFRFLQGFAASGAAVLAAGLIRSLFGELGTVRAVGAMGSIEALVPGLAPIAGAWLHGRYGWTMSFILTAILVGALALTAFLYPKLLPSIGVKKEKTPGSYGALLRNPAYVRYGLGHALVLAGLLTFVFSAPSVIITTMGGTIEHFIYMQTVGVSFFILCANLSGSLVKRFGSESVILTGTLVASVGSLLLLTYALVGSNDPSHLMYIFWVLNSGLGLRAAPGFVQALIAANGDDDRASALILVGVTGFSAAATALIAPFLSGGLIVLTAATALIIIPTLLLMILIKALPPISPEKSQSQSQPQPQSQPKSPAQSGK